MRDNKESPFTLRSELSFPAKANNSVVLPDPGGPKSKVILVIKLKALVSGQMQYSKPDWVVQRGKGSLLPARFDDSTDIMKDGQRPLPTR